MPLPIVSHLSVRAELRERLIRKRLIFSGKLVRPAGFEPAAFGSGGSMTSAQTLEKTITYGRAHTNCPYGSVNQGTVNRSTRAERWLDEWQSAQQALVSAARWAALAYLVA